MQKSTKLTLGASKIAFCAGDDLPRAKGTCLGWGIRGGECERAGIAPSPSHVTLLRFCRNPAFRTTEAERQPPAIPLAP
jgi:hypothetical protein